MKHYVKCSIIVTSSVIPLWQRYIQFGGREGSQVRFSQGGGGWGHCMEQPLAPAPLWKPHLLPLALPNCESLTCYPPGSAQLWKPHLLPPGPAQLWKPHLLPPGPSQLWKPHLVPPGPAQLWEPHLEHPPTQIVGLKECNTAVSGTSVHLWSV